MVRLASFALLLASVMVDGALVYCEREAAVGSRREPLHQVISAGGREPQVRHSISVLRPAETTNTRRANDELAVVGGGGGDNAVPVSERFRLC